MLAFLGNITNGEILFVLLLFAIGIILPIWLVIEIIRYLRRH